MGKRNPELEAVIAGSPDDPAPYLVYADWLTAEGDPRGELIVVQHKLSEADDPALRKRERELMSADLLGGEIDPELATFTWQWGFLRGVRLFNLVDWMDSSFDVLPLVKQIFTAPVAALVRELRLGVIRWMENGEDVPAILESVAELGAARRIELLHLGDVHDIDCDLAHHPLGDVSIISRAYPHLRSLTLHGCDFTLGALDLPALRSLTIETCGLDAADVRAIAAADWPELEELTLWFGSSDYGSTSTVNDLDRLLAGTGLPKLRRLGLANSEMTGEIAQALAGSPLLPQLTELDLSMGTLDDEEAGALVAIADQLSHLEKLDVSESFLTDEGISALRTIGCPIVADEQKELEPGEEDWRYVSQGE